MIDHAAADSPEPSSRPQGPVLVSGGTGGLGAEICRVLADDGCAVAFTYRTNDVAAADLVAELAARGVPARAHRVDLTDAAAVDRCVAVVLQDLGGLGVLVHAAGPHIPMVHLSRVTPAQYLQQLAEEAAGFFNLVHAALPALRASAGSAVAVTTAATTRFPIRDGLSSGTKGAVEALVRGFAAEEGRFGVRFNCVGPGMLTDGMAVRLMASGDLDERALAVARGNIPLRRFGSARDVAEAVRFLASPRAGFISGQKLDVDGGYGV